VEKPVVELNKWRERAIGAAMLISLSTALIGKAVASYWQTISALFRN